MNMCYVVVLLNRTFYVQYYPQAKDLQLECYAIYIPVCMNDSLHVADKFL